MFVFKIVHALCAKIVQSVNTFFLMPHIVKQGQVDHKGFGLFATWQNKCFAVLTSDRYLR